MKSNKTRKPASGLLYFLCSASTFWRFRAQAQAVKG